MVTQDEDEMPLGKQLFFSCEKLQKISEKTSKKKKIIIISKKTFQQLHVGQMKREMVRATFRWSMSYSRSTWSWQTLPFASRCPRVSVPQWSARATATTTTMRAKTSSSGNCPLSVSFCFTFSFSLTWNFRLFKQQWLTRIQHFRQSWRLFPC